METDGVEVRRQAREREGLVVACGRRRARGPDHAGVAECATLEVDFIENDDLGKPTVSKCASST